MTFPPGLIISATGSGVGKTTLSLGLMRALGRQGQVVQPFKGGPDYIDPGFHTAATGRRSINLDSWAMPRAMVGGLLSAAEGADLCVLEGAMGLFDGVAMPGQWGTGAVADMAAQLGWPVVLVIDVSGQAQTAGAVARGFAEMRTDVTIAGVVANKVASPRHAALVDQGLAQAGVKCLGHLPRMKGLEMPERHLGLVQAQEHERLDAMIEAMADFVAQNLDLAQILAAAGPTRRPVGRAHIRPPGQRIALAQDRAFSFVYPHLVQGWQAAGAEIIPFSPLADEGPDPTADICWLPGGYPELYAGALAGAQQFKARLRAFASHNRVHGECGGYMAMGTALIDKDGVRHEMAGLLGLVSSYHKRKMHLGYRRAQLLQSLPGYGAGATLAGHEFHFSSVLEQPDAPLAHVVDANGAVVAETGGCRGLASGSYFHLISEIS
ncbi:cobyrinate a,c-diamide synthase [Rhodobacteraceae bacterium]|nr:cobyrinate a,c-diamide synthase [Paracoccaceae bacterium]